MNETTSDPDRPRRISEPLVLALIGLGVAALLFAGAAVPVLLSREDDSADSIEAGTTPPSVEPTVVAEETGPPATTTPADATITSTESNPSTTAPLPIESMPTETTEPIESMPTETTETTETTMPVPTDEVSVDSTPAAESRAIVRDGKLYLQGAVPDEEARNEIVALASEIFGPENVIDGYVVDAGAGDPNLGNVQVSDAVLFETDSAVITAAFEPLLNQGLALLQIRPGASFAFEGHTDSRGSDLYNLYLSQLRADAVVRWYTDRGVDPSRLSGLGRGETELVASDDTPEGRQMNRRIEVTIDNLLGEPA